MSKRVYSLLLTGVFLTFPLVINAQTDLPVMAGGKTGANFLRLEPMARPAGMGEAFVGVADDINAIFSNPAGLSLICLHGAKYKELCGAHAEWFQGIRNEYFAYAQPLNEDNAIGVALQYFTVSGLEARTSISDDPLYTFGAYDLALYLSGGHAINDKLSAGATLKLTRHSIDRYTASGAGLDVGVMYSYTDSITFGAALQNLGIISRFTDSQKRGLMPLQIKGGMGYQLPRHGPMAVLGKSLISVQVDVPVDYSPSLSIGIEATPWKYLTLRLGYKAVILGFLDIPGISRISFGIGLKYQNFSLDYVMVPYGDLGITERVSLTLGIR